MKTEPTRPAGVALQQIRYTCEVEVCRYHTEDTGDAGFEKLYCVYSSFVFDHGYAHRTVEDVLRLNRALFSRMLEAQGLMLRGLVHYQRPTGQPGPPQVLEHLTLTPEGLQVIEV
ncbi:hypothetical protein [Deinococcus cellulosilyticus]|uniref:Uncharacterized protein n=1 Tax=Deinococcus cellulosilyticus (strain DSM 18568 / NBRC 106333 / KACC 11606 / 5516J-15) TaxID=1223518 RepID=A0A511NB77_DEIC1|nr:hypothetical protein [Deinococcus cellulosilyticus]GEM49641.1 hypothetical protein DC3_52760 [Deinococcus cellulosilyticus NBRC 106333 = KACC 11606]